MGLGLAVLVASAPNICVAASRKGSKRTGLSIQQLMDITADDVGRKKSLVTGQLDKSVYEEQFDFGDPSGVASELSAQKGTTEVTLADVCTPCLMQKPHCLCPAPALAFALLFLSAPHCAHLP